MFAPTSRGVLLRNMREIARELRVCLRRSAKNVFISPRYDGLADRVHSARGQLNRHITKLHAMSMRPYTTVDDRAHCNRGQPNRRIAPFFNTRVYGENAELLWQNRSDKTL